MVKHKYIDWICIGAAVLAAMLTILLMFGEQLGIPKASANPGYVTRLFDDSRVHTIDIQIADWGAFIADAEGEEYVACTVEIDGEAFHNIWLRAKGDISLRLTEDYGLEYYAAFPGCSAETEASFYTIAFLAEKVSELELPAVLAIDGSDGTIARTIADNTETRDQKVLTMDSMQAVDWRDVQAGADYLSAMENNLAVLKEALGAGGE